MILVALVIPFALAADKNDSPTSDSSPAPSLKSAEARPKSTSVEAAISLEPTEKNRGEEDSSREKGVASQLSNDVKSTHKQLRVIKPYHADKPLTLLNYCLDKSGNLWMSVSTGSRYPTDTTSRAPKEVNFVQVYDADGNLKAEYPLEFVATAMNFAEDDTLVLAGEGKVARMSANGEILKQSPTPNIGDMEEFKTKMIEEAKKERAKSSANWTRQIKTLDDRLKRIEEKEPDESKRSPQEKMMVQQLTMQKKQFEQMAESMEKAIDTESLIRRRLSVPGVAGTAKEVFIVLAGANGYEVWRTDYDFENGKVVANRLSGCCGNMDVQACREGFVASINGEFKVVEFDRDGKRLISFGKRDRSASDGFGSCCNPMNCRILSNGDYIVAESSIGHIKKFDSKGKFIEVVGKAKISGGCKHCSLGYDEKLNRYYMMNEDRNHVCVLVPLSEAPEYTEEELQAKDAREGLGRKLIGEWREDKPETESVKDDDNIKNALFFQNNRNKPIQIKFVDDGTAKISGGMFDNFRGTEFSWEPVSQRDGILEFTLYMDGVEFITEKIKFDPDDNQLQFTSKSNYYFNGINTLLRSKSAGEAK